MTGPQTEIEIRLWRDEFARMRQTPEWTDAAMDAADDLLHRYRARYGQPQPAADDRLGRAAIEAMDAIIGVMGDEDRPRRQARRDRSLHSDVHRTALAHPEGERQVNRDEQEMIMWRSEYVRSTMRDAANRAAEADAAVAEFRKRYPVEPAAPPAVWYDEPPLPKNGKSHPCWVDGCAVHGDVYWLETEWRVWIVGSAYDQPLAGRPVSPIVKPSEPPQ